MKRTLFVGIAIFIYSLGSFSQEVVVDVKVKPALSFKIKTKDVKGFVNQKNDEIEASDIRVGLTNISTGISLRDKHTKEYLDVKKYPDAILVSAKGKGGTGEGMIEIKGIRKPISGTYQIENGKVMAQFPLMLKEFGITGVKYMGAGVEDKVVVNISIPISSQTGKK